MTDHTRYPSSYVVLDAGKLRGLMDDKDVSIVELADAAGVSRGTIYNALAGKRVMRRIARQLAGALERMEPNEELAQLLERSK